ncbi:MAG: bifunctional [glutamate--ammonia ligase]-adenylyl-L-tyrosine phosphorylase/[glutamate--ammonia-ligase] adenylyltransferase [Candidatus Competibacterales bacterium]
MGDIERAIQRLPEPLREGVARHWEDVAPSLDTHREVVEAVSEALIRVWACSDYVARYHLRQPQELVALIASGRIRRPLAPGEAVILGAGEEFDAAALRRARHRALVRIAWRDLANLASTAETLEELTAVADGLIQAACRHNHHQLSQRWGEPLDRQGCPQSLVVLGLGKLGGGELNFSSDIDLIFTYPEAGVTRLERDNEAFFRRQGQRLVADLGEVTAEGFVYRVDMRLRPFGSAGPLVASFAALEDYYQRLGRDWERYALIKARAVVDGDGRGRELLANLSPFVYRRYLDYGAVEHLREMKTAIVAELQREDLVDDIKRGSGGIREIEFIVQAFQLIYGGREPDLRQRRLAPALAYLSQSGRLPVAAGAVLAEAYEFLRRLENRLQMVADQQTHRLPRDPRERLRLAFAMGYDDWPPLAEALALHRQRVTEQFDRVFATGSEALPRPKPSWAQLWAGETSGDQALQLLATASLEPAGGILRQLTALRSSASYRALDQRGRQRLDRLVPRLLALAEAGSHGALAVERILTLLEVIAQRSAYLALLADHPQVLDQLLTLCGASPWFSRHLGRFPLLIDELLSPSTLFAPLDSTALAAALDRELRRARPSGDEALLDALRYFKQTQALRVAAADVFGHLPLMKVSDHLTAIAEVCLQQVMALAYDDLVARHGPPAGEPKPSIAVVAYGKLGGIELSYGSDLDLVFLHDSSGGSLATQGPRVVDNGTFFVRLAQRAIHYLTARTNAGLLYPVDVRLRPSGRAGVLVSGIEAYNDYQRQRAWTWEHQALVRARLVVGSHTMATRFDDLRRAILCFPRDLEALRQEVATMRRRMVDQLGSQGTAFDLKHDPGGLIDAEFLVQFLVLGHASQHPELVEFADNVRQIAALEATGVMSAPAAQDLRESYLSLRAAEHRLALQEAPDKRLATDALLEPRRVLASLWRQWFCEKES